jgi:signal transduction histidine kinase
MRRGAKPVTTTVAAGRPAARRSRVSSTATTSALEQHLAEALEREAATSAILRVISQSSRDVQPVFATIVKNAVRLCEARFGAVFRLDGGLVYLAAHHNFSATELARYFHTYYPMAPNRGHVSGRTILTCAAIQVPDILADDGYLGAGMKAAGFRSLLGVPLLRGRRAIGAILIYRAEPGQFADKHIELLKTFADQAVIAIENVRLFNEIKEKSRQLETASRHKSEFLANMSHELRTPLNAIIGFSEVLVERLFGEINDKQAEYLRDILESGQHLLSLINDILDLSKIEAGRMELEPTDFDLPSAIENTLTLVRERAHRRGIALKRAIDNRLEMIRADERKVKQVLLNLLSNALKFTPEGGQIDVRATLRDRAAEISVTDTGVGIAPEEQEAVFEEFRQVGMASKKVEGTGLGLAISRKFIELHGGRIWVTSEVGSGSTFTFTLPLR